MMRVVGDVLRDVAAGLPMACEVRAIAGRERDMALLCPETGRGVIAAHVWEDQFAEELVVEGYCWVWMVSPPVEGDTPPLLDLPGWGQADLEGGMAFSEGELVKSASGWLGERGALLLGLAGL